MLAGMRQALAPVSHVRRNGDSMNFRSFLLFASLAMVACDRQPTPAPTPMTIDEVAAEYLLLELSIGQHDAAHVDAYFGPDILKTTAADAELSLSRIDTRMQALDQRLQELGQLSDDAEGSSRIAGLRARLTAARARIRLNRGEMASFDEESQDLFGTQAPDNDGAHFDAILARIDALIPGDGALADRVDAFQQRFAIPIEQLPQVFDAAIAECRRRTLEFIDLPQHESFTLEYVTDKPWSGYNWYQGDAQSLIQINTDLPIFISRAVDLGCHEGYPGHHTYNALLEQNLVLGKRWIEFSLYPLFSPQSLIAEGSGNYGIDLAFPGDERVRFEKDVLFPLAGMDVDEAERYYALQAELAKLSYAGNEAARDYLNGDMTREQAVEWLTKYTLTSTERANQRVDFIDTYRSYVINYNLGLDMVRNYVERDTTTAEERWAKFEAMLSNPLLPADL